LEVVVPVHIEQVLMLRQMEMLVDLVVAQVLLKMLEPEAETMVELVKAAKDIQEAEVHMPVRVAGVLVEPVVMVQEQFPEVWVVQEELESHHL
jgi:hypothetical protein